MAENEKLERFINVLNTLDLNGRIDIMYETAKNIVRSKKKLDNALKQELETSAFCSRAKRTTLYANSHKISSVYHKQIDELRIIVKTL